MNDEALAFLEDVREKSIVARSANHKARRSKHMHSENYSGRELARLSGPVYQYNVSKPMTYEEFKALPANCQREYIQTLVDKYGIGSGAIASMFGRDNKSGCVTHLFRRLGVIAPRQVPKEVSARFLAEFCGLSDKASKTDSAPAMPPKPEYGQKPKQEAALDTITDMAADMVIQNVVLRFTGKFSPESVTRQLRGLFPAGAPVKIRIEVEAAD